MKCSEIKRLLPQYANDELPQAQENDFNKHLADCPDCRAALEDYRFLRSKSQQTDAVPAAPELVTATMEKIKAMPDAGATETRKAPLRHWLRPALAIATAAAVLALAVIQPWSLDAQGVLARASEAISELESYRMTKTQTNTYHYRKPDWYSAEVERAANPQRFYTIVYRNGSTFELLSTDHKFYVCFKTTPSSYPYLGPMVVIPSMPTEESTTWMLGRLTDLETLPDAKVDGVNCWHYRGRLDLELLASQGALKAATGMNEAQLGDLERVITDVEVWIGKEDYLLRLSRREIRVPALSHSGNRFFGWNTSTTETRYYDFNAPITVEPPVTDSGELLPGWEEIELLPWPAP